VSHIARDLLLVIVIASWVYWLMAWYLVRAFFKRGRRGREDFRPSVSLLKPVRGADEDLYENLASFCRQDYENFEVLFGVADASDPAIAVIRKIERDFPELRIKLVMGPSVGANPKVSLLRHLSQHAHSEVLVASDSDIRVTPDYLARVVRPLKDPAVGLVSCLYSGRKAENLMARMSGLYMDSTFLPSAVVASRMGVRLGLGATSAVRREDLVRAGGFEMIVDHLAEDFQLAQLIGRLGLKATLSDYVVSSVLGTTSFREQWDREIRWLRGIRVSCPERYPGLLLTFSTPLAVGMALVRGFWPLAGAILAVSLLVRWLVAWQISSDLGQKRQERSLAWLPLRDCMTGLVWCAATFGRRVVWRDKAYTLLNDGRLRRLPRRSGRRTGLTAGLFRRVDRWLRRRQRIFQFSRARQCVFRIALGHADREVHLSDGTRLSPGDGVAELHMWNEHVPPIPREGPDIAWGMAMNRRVRRSLRDLAQRVSHDERYRGAKAFGGWTALAHRNGNGQFGRIVRGLGFDLIDAPRPGLWRRCHDFGENILIWGLLWTFNRHALRGRKFFRVRQQLWMSRKTLLAKYGSNGKKANGHPVARKRDDQDVDAGRHPGRDRNVAAMVHRSPD
jgi:ceramide glucosyltransferase